MLDYYVRQLFIGQPAGAKSIDHDRNRFRHSDGICQLYLAFIRKSCRNHVLCHISGRICGRPVHFRGILAAETASPMMPVPSVGVHNYLSTRKAGISVGSSYYESAGGVDQDLCVFVHEFFGYHGFYHKFHKVLLYRRKFHIRIMLSGYEDRIYPFYFFPVILHSYLGFAVGSQIFDFTVFSYLCQLSCQLMRKRYGHRHKFLCFIACITEHYALISGTARIYSHGYISRLFIYGCHYSTCVSVKSVFALCISYITNDLSYYLGYVHITFGAYFSHDHGIPRVDTCLCRHSSLWIVCQYGIHYGIGYLVTYLVRMTFGNRF